MIGHLLPLYLVGCLLYFPISVQSPLSQMISFLVIAVLEKEAATTKRFNFNVLLELPDHWNRIELTLTKTSVFHNS